MTSRERALLALGLGGLTLAGSVVLPGTGSLPPAWVAACVFWGGLSLGSLTLLYIHQLTGGDWGEALQRPLLGAVAALPLLILLLLPLLFAPAGWYPWAGTGEAAGDLPAWYLNVPFFRIRAMLYLALWLALAWATGAWGDRPASVAARAQAVSAGGLILLGISSSFAAFDWIMSLDPHWYSAVFGLLVGVSQATAALALAVLWCTGGQGGTFPGPQRLHDFGNLLLTLLLLWTYLAGIQFITVWIADLPREIRWYLPRLETDWRWLGIAVVTLQLFLPLPLLLSRTAKRTRLPIGLAAALLLCAQCLYALWLTLPTLHPGGVRFTWADVAAFAGIGGLWLAAFLWRSVPPAVQAAAGRAGGLT